MHQHGSSNPPQPVGKASLQENRQPTRLSLPIKVVLYVSIGIIAFFLITEHLAQLVGFFPLLSILFICMLMHLFMHGGHGGHGGGNGGNSQSLAKDPQLDSTNQSTLRSSNHEGHE